MSSSKFIVPSLPSSSNGNWSMKEKLAAWRASQTVTGSGEGKGNNRPKTPIPTDLVKFQQPPPLSSSSAAPNNNALSGLEIRTKPPPLSDLTNSNNYTSNSTAGLPRKTTFAYARASAKLQHRAALRTKEAAKDVENIKPIKEDYHRKGAVEKKKDEDPIIKPIAKSGKTPLGYSSLNKHTSSLLVNKQANKREEKTERQIKPQPQAQVKPQPPIQTSAPAQALTSIQQSRNNDDALSSSDDDDSYIDGTTATNHVTDDVYDIINALNTSINSVDNDEKDEDLAGSGGEGEGNEIEEVVMDEEFDDTNNLSEFSKVKRLRGNDGGVKEDEIHATPDVETPPLLSPAIEQVEQVEVLPNTSLDKQLPEDESVHKEKIVEIEADTTCDDDVVNKLSNDTSIGDADADDEKDSSSTLRHNLPQPLKITHKKTKPSSTPGPNTNTNLNNQLIRMTKVATRYREEHDALRFYVSVLKQDILEKSDLLQTSSQDYRNEISRLRREYDEEIEELKCEYADTESMIQNLTTQLKTGLSVSIGKNKELEKKLEEERGAREELERKLEKFER